MVILMFLIIIYVLGAGFGSVWSGVCGGASKVEEGGGGEGD